MGKALLERSFVIGRNINHIFKHLFFMRKSILGLTLGMLVGLFLLVSCDAEEQSFTEENAVVPATEALVDVSKATQSLNMTTGEFRATPGSWIKMDYSASKGAACSAREKLRISVSGANPYMSPVNFSWQYAFGSGSKRFRMPASGVVKVRAEMRDNGQGCSRVSIKFNRLNEIRLGTGGFGKRSFP